MLGPRWVYDACADPVYVAALANAIVGATGQAEEFVENDGRLERRARTMTVTGSGVPGAEPPAVGTVRRITDGDPTIVAVDAGSSPWCASWMRTPARPDLC
ncbi:hypothetical protein JQS43_15215 [Natronosporangium hydrolyticum]|uniref:Uncharacterized protein n=1 Tax=Natronosporangium hydrolyticum TaxID=2811111 RepID=A0A895Y5M3_9ACTN|nr:hypothetical protein JQS43_15215 [Natronosporangium hydrolyticum]